MPQPSVQPRRRSFLGRLIRTVFTLGLLIVVLAVAVPFLVPAEQYKDLIQDQAKRFLGRQLTIAGSMSFSILPRLALQMNDVSLEGLPDDNRKDFIQIKQLEAVVATWPLLRGDIQVERFVLDQPSIHLEMNKKGQANWNFSPPQEKSAATKEAPSRETANNNTSSLDGLRIASFQIVNGIVSYTDVKNPSSALEFKDVDAKVSVPGLDDEAQASAEADFRGQRVRLNLTLNEPREFLAQRRSRATIKASAGGALLDYTGHVQNVANTPSAEGQLNINVSDVPALMSFISQKPASGDMPLKSLSLKSAVEASKNSVALSGLTFDAGTMTAKGDLRVALNRTRPFVEGTLDFSTLDLNKFMSEKTPSSAELKGISLISSAIAAPAQEWSRENFDVAGLKSVDAKVKISLDKLIVKKIETGPTTLDVGLDNGHFKTSFPATSVFDGTVQGLIGLNTAESTPAAYADLDIKSVQVEPMLKAIADFHRLTGTADGKISLRASGKSQYAMTQNLNGDGNFIVKDGSIKGINVAAMMRNIGSAFTAGSDTEKTDFAELSSNFKATNGVIHSTLQMLAPVLRLTGEGQIDVPPQTVNYRLEPKLVASLEGQGGASELGGLMVPVVVTGTFDKLRFSPDLSSIMKDPKGALDQLKELRDRLKGKKPAATEPVPAPAPASPTPSPTEGAPAPTPAPSTEATPPPSGETAPSSSAEPAPTAAPSQPSEKEQKKEAVKQLLRGLLKEQK